MDKFYSQDSSNEGATLSQLRNLINRRNVVTKVTKDYHAVSGFVDTVLESHIIAALMKHLNIESIDDTPKAFPKRLAIINDKQKKIIIKNIIGGMIDNFIFTPMAQRLQQVVKADCNAAPNQPEDHVFNYATNFMKYGLIRAVTLLTTASADGNRAVRNWKYSLLVYHQSQKIKYRLESFLLQAAVKALLPPRLVEQVKWSRFINYSGGIGNNLDGDYVMELLNKLAKNKIKNLGPNHTPEMVMRIGKIFMFCHDITRNFEKQLGIAPSGHGHTNQNITKDHNLMITELHTKVKVFDHQPGRQHPTFGTQPVDIFSECKVADLHQWLNAKRIEYGQGKWAF